MLRILTLATLFPNPVQPTLGVFVEKQILGLAERPEAEVQVVAPIGVPVWPLAAHPHYARFASVPLREDCKGLAVHRPRFRVWPRFGAAGAARRLAARLRPYLAELRERFPFDVIDAEYFWPDGPAALSLGQAFGVPVSIKARGSDIHFWGREPGIGGQIVAAGRSASGLLAVSDWLKREMAGLGIPEEKIRVHRTGVDLRAFAPGDRAAAKARLGLEGPVLACVGALVDRKRPELALAALAELPSATLILIGDGPARARLEGLAGKLGVSDRVRFHGVRPHAELPSWLAAADLLIHPSAAEGLANVWVEAMACGVPVIACDVGGAREAIAEDAGRIVAPDPAAIAAAARALLENPPPIEAVRRSAARFSWDRNGEELLAHLAGLVGGRMASERHQGRDDPAILAA